MPRGTLSIETRHHSELVLQEGGESMASVDVRCTVNNCYFWAKNDTCSADSILITADTAADDGARMAFGSENHGHLAASMGDTPAQNMASTACHTFKAK